MIYGYCRVSTRFQNIERQIENIKSRYKDAIIYKEAYTGTKVDGRKELQKLMRVVRSGDTIVFDSVSRLSRNADNGIEIYFDLYDKGVNLIFLKEPTINTENYRNAAKSKIQMTGGDVDIILEAVNEYLMVLARQQIKIAFDQAQKEVDDLHIRTSEGMKVAKGEGKRIGLPKGGTWEPKRKQEVLKRIQEVNRSYGGQLKDNETASMVHISMNTLYKYKREINEKLIEENRI